MNSIRKVISLLLALIIITACACVTAESVSWVCAECGKENTTKYCTKCGAKKPEDIVCPGCGMNYPADTDAVYCGECGTKLQQDSNEDSAFTYEGKGFKTAEEAVLCYLAGIKNLDLAQTLSAFAWETQADHYDFKAFLSRVKQINPAMVPGMPVFNDLSRSVMLEQIRYSQTNYICRALENYINSEMTSSGTGALVFTEDNPFDEYMARCDNGRIDNLAAMKNIRFYDLDDVTEGKYSSEPIQKFYVPRNAVYGADETKDVFATVDIGTETYAITPTAARYGDRWYIVSSNSLIADIYGIITNAKAFFELPVEMKEQLNSVTPVAQVDVLPGNSARAVSYEGEGFESPEEAVNCYFSGLKDGNVTQMLKAFAWETQASHYSLKDYADWTQSINQNAPIRMSIDNPLMNGINLNSLRYNQSRRIYFAIRYYILKDDSRYEELLNGYMMDMKEEEEIDAFIQAFDNENAGKLKTIHNIRLIDPAKVIKNYNTDSAAKRLDAFKKIYGADELKDVLAAADVDGETLVINPMIARYGDKWYMVSVDGTAFSFLGIEAQKAALLCVNESDELASLLK